MVCFLRIFVALIALQSLIIQSADSLKNREQKEKKQTEEIMQAQEQQSLVKPKKKISELLTHQQIRGFSNIMYHSRMPAVIREMTYDLCKEFGSLVATLKTSQPKLASLSGLNIADDGRLIACWRKRKTGGGVTIWHTPLSVQHAEHEDKRTAYSLDQSFPTPDPRSKQCAIATYPNMQNKSTNLSTFNAFSSRMNSLNQHTIVCTGNDGDIVIWDTATGNERILLTRGQRNSSNIVVHTQFTNIWLSADKTQITAVANESAAITVDLTTGDILRKDPIRTNTELLLALRDSRVILNGCYYNQETKAVQQLQLHSKDNYIVGALTLSRDRVATVNLHGAVEIWNKKTGECVGTIQHGHTWLKATVLRDMIELPNGHLATAGINGVIRIWNENHNPYRDTLEEIRAEKKKAAEIREARDRKIADLKKLAAKLFSFTSRDKKTN